MKFENIFLVGLIVIAAALALKSIKQFIYLSFTLLSLKAVWVLLIILFILTSLKKRTQPSGKKND
jgi:tartrate dehydratase beta subunit/fumarate hydratase class I family protein